MSEPVAPWAFGIDPGSRRIALAGVHAFDPSLWMAMPRQWRGEKEQMAISVSIAKAQAATKESLWRARDVGGLEPFTIALERPSGISANPSLMMHTGAIVAGATSLDRPPQPYLFKGAPDWRKRLGVSDPNKKETLYPLLDELGFEEQADRGLDIDEKDALGIAIAAMLQQVPDWLELRRAWWAGK